MWGETRADALRHLGASLARYQVVGLPNNIGFLRRTAGHPGFVSGGVDTSFLGHHLPECLPLPTPAPPEAVAAAALAVAFEYGAAAAAEAAAASGGASPWGGSDGARPGLPAAASIPLAFVDEGVVAPAAAAAGAGAAGAAAATHAHAHATLRPLPPPLPGKPHPRPAVSAGPGARPLQFSLSLGGAPGVQLMGSVAALTGEVPGRSAVPGFVAATTGRAVAGVAAYGVAASLGGASVYKATVVTAVERDGGGVEVTVFPEGGAGPDAPHEYRLRLPAPRFGKAGAGGGSGAVKTPMPGKVVRVLAKVGDAVVEGQPLLILEAMKMEVRV